jgi:hypothetical protein
MEQRTVARFFVLESPSPQDIHTELEPMYIYDTLGLRKVFKWHELFVARENGAI